MRYTGLIEFDRDGAAADFVTVPEAGLATKPSTVSHAAAAALPLAGLTALQALVDHAAMQPGESVLVHGGAGGVGALAVQLGAILGAQVTATVRSDAGELLRGFGAQRVIDVRTEAFDETGGAYDVVIDTVGGQTLDRSFRVLRRGGRLVCLSEPRPAGRADEYGVTATFFIVEPNRDQLIDASLRWSTVWRPRKADCAVEIAQTYPLDKGREAFESGLETGPSPEPARGQDGHCCPGLTGSSVMTAVGKIVVIGASGLIGAKVVDILTANGAQVLPASRRTGVDVLTGDGSSPPRCPKRESFST